MRFVQDEKGSEIQMNMLPLIDCVFQVIIFFMIMADLSKRELEELYLPQCRVAVEDQPSRTEARPVVNILPDGSMFVLGEKYYDPRRDDGYAKLLEYLVGVARAMPKERDPMRPAGPSLPRGAVLIRADQSTPAKYVQKVMELCGTTGVRIWKVELAAATLRATEGKPAVPVPDGGGR